MKSDLNACSHSNYSNNKKYGEERLKMCQIHKLYVAKVIQCEVVHKAILILTCVYAIR